MLKSEFFKSKWVKVVIGLIIILLAILIFQNGYEFGQYLRSGSGK